MAVAAGFLFWGQADSLGDFGQKALVTVGLFAVAGLAARESQLHRRVAVWSDTRAVQLKTVGAYTQGMESEIRDDVRRLLAMGVFGPPPTTTRGGGDQLGPALELLERAIGVGKDVGRTRGDA